MTHLLLIYGISYILPNVKFNKTSISKQVNTKFLLLSVFSCNISYKANI